ncbi:MAG: tetratricopeptide repeat protein [Candidatus Aquicultor sp.]
MELRKGKAAFESKDYETAIEYFNKALKQDNNNYEAYLWLGKSYLNLSGENSQTAIDYINKYLEHEPNNSEAYVYLGDAYQEKFIKYIYNDYLFKQSLPKVFGKIHFKVDTLKFNYNAVSDKSIECYQKAININPQEALAYYRLGYDYGFKKEDLKQGINFYEKGIKINPNYTNVYYQLGLLYKNIQNYTEAKNNFLLEISNDSTNAETYFELAQILIKQNQNEEAVKYLDTFLAINKTHSEIYYLLGKAYLTPNRNESINNFTISARMNNEDAKKWLKNNHITW